MASKSIPLTKIRELENLRLSNNGEKSWLINLRLPIFLRQLHWDLKGNVRRSGHLDWQFSHMLEAIVMVEGCDYGMSGEQWAEQICYINKVKEDWKRDKKEFRKYRDFLSSTEERLC